MRGIIVGVLALFAVKASALSTWIQISSPTVVMFTDSGEKTARAVLHRFETLRRVFNDSKIAAAPAPVRVYVFAARRDFLEYEIDRNGAGFYHSGDDREFIVAYEDTALQRIASHEYLHMVIGHAS